MGRPMNPPSATDACGRDQRNLEEVTVTERSLEPFSSLLSPEAWTGLQATMETARSAFRGRVFWHVNSTPQGGGVAEMLESLVAYLRGAGIDARWSVIGGDDDFFHLTKRLHNQLHGSAGDGGPLGAAERRSYESALAPYRAKIGALVRAGDVVMLHDPQTAGLLDTVVDAGAIAIWRCHVGTDEPNELAHAAWRFLGPALARAHALVFSRRAHVWEGLDDRKVAIIPPALDVFSPKNELMDQRTADAVLAAVGLVDRRAAVRPSFRRSDGSRSEIRRRVELVDGAPPLPAMPFVTQVSRFDLLKDPQGVIRAFCRHVVPASKAPHLLIAGPAVCEVADDPDGADVVAATKALLRELPAEARARVRVALLPMDDDEENSAIVSAIQTSAEVIVQKSLAEGFGLTVTEAMWKGRPVVGSRVGGITDQIIDGVTGFLVDAEDDVAFGEVLLALLGDPKRAREMGANGRARVIEHFLETRHLADCLTLACRFLT
jgi:trehalose synthase